MHGTMKKTGVFSVKSAYRMLISNRERRTNWIEHNTVRSDMRADQKEWTDLWNVKVPSKVRVFLWRLAKQSIPTRDVRHHRNMAQNSNCSICGRQDSWRHSLLECKMAKCVWALQGEELVEFIRQSSNDDARSWLHEAVEALRHDELVRLVVTMSSIWHARRKAIHENIFQSPLSTHSFVERFLVDLELVTPKAEKKEGVQVQVPRWIPPPQGTMKVNVDAATSKNSCIATLVAIVRDEASNFQGAYVVVMEGISSPEIAEAMACIEGLALASDLMLRKVRIAMDCANIVKSIQGPGMGLYGHITREIKVGLASFKSAEIVHESRNSNVDAHR